jgi:hypothetical protein
VPRGLQQENKPLFRTLLTFAALVLLGCVTAPPVQEMSDARQAITAAEAANAERLAPESLRDARRFLAEAEQQLQQQAYGPARFNAVRAKNRAAMALSASKASSQDRN